MSKSDLVKDHILTAAKGLTTDDLHDLAKQIGKLEKQKVKEVLASIPAYEVDELCFMYEALCDSTQINLKSEIHLCVSVCTDNVEEGALAPYFIVTAKNRGGYYDSSIEVDELFHTKDLLLIPEIKAQYEVGKRALAVFEEKLKTTAEKYKVTTELLLSHVLDK